MSFCLVGIGSNLGDRTAQVRGAMAKLRSQDGIEGLVASSLHKTAPIGGPPGQPPFVNAVVAFESTRLPEALLAQLQRIEHELGRQPGERWSARTIDLDLLLHDDLVIDTPHLVVPHPRMAFRRFVLRPAAEVAPRCVHPTIGWTMARLLEHVDTALPYVALLGVPGSGKTSLAARVAATLAGSVVADPAPRILGPADRRESGPAYAAEIELLAARAGLLDRRVERQPSVPWLSDFYLDQALAYAETSLPAPELDAFRHEFEARAAQVTLPKLLVVLDTRPSPPPIATSTPEMPDDALRQRLLALAALPGIGPVLYAGRDDPDWQFQEVVAAVQAMQASTET